MEGRNRGRGRDPRVDPAHLHSSGPPTVRQLFRQVQSAPQEEEEEESVETNSGGYSYHKASSIITPTLYRSLLINIMQINQRFVLFASILPRLVASIGSGDMTATKNKNAETPHKQLQDRHLQHKELNQLR